MFVLRMKNQTGMKKVIVSDSYNKIEKYIHDNFDDVKQISTLFFQGWYKDEQINFQIELCEVL